MVNSHFRSLRDRRSGSSLLKREGARLELFPPAIMIKSLTFGLKASARHERRANSQAPCGRAPL